MANSALHVISFNNLIGRGPFKLSPFPSPRILFFLGVFVVVVFRCFPMGLLLTSILYSCHVLRLSLLMHLIATTNQCVCVVLCALKAIQYIQIPYQSTHDMIYSYCRLRNRDNYLYSWGNTRGGKTRKTNIKQETKSN